MLHFVLDENALLSLHQQITGGYYGLGIPILFLRGSSVQKLPDRYRSMSGFGDGKFRSDKWWKAFGESALLSRYQLLNELPLGSVRSYCQISRVQTVLFFSGPVISMNGFLPL